MISPQQTDDSLTYILILHFRGIHHTQACLNSLRNLDYPRYKIVLIDNGSPDHSGQEIAKQFPEVTLIDSGENLGFSGGCNVGIKYCLQSGAKWIWLLNNDTTVKPDSLKILFKAAQNNPSAGALGSVLTTSSGKQFADSGRGEIDFLRAKTFLRPVDGSNCSLIECQWLSGSNLLLRAEALKRVGLFDDRYFLYFEDTDLCFRLREAGWTCLLVPEAKIEHVGGASTEGKHSYWRAYYYTRNRLLFFIDHSQGLKRLPIHFSIAAHLLRHALVLPFRGEAGIKQLKAELLGLRDFFGNQFGKARCLDWLDEDP